MTVMSRYAACGALEAMSSTRGGCSQLLVVQVEQQRGKASKGRRIRKRCMVTKRKLKRHQNGWMVAATAANTAFSSSSGSSSVDSGRSQEWDAVIIGSGVGGLTTATQLASKGAKVLVLEK